MKSIVCLEAQFDAVMARLVAEYFKRSLNHFVWIEDFTGKLDRGRPTRTLADVALTPLADYFHHVCLLEHIIDARTCLLEFLSLGAAHLDTSKEVSELTEEE